MAVKHKLQDLNTLIPTSELIELAQAQGVSFGKGNPYERVRYFVKLGLLPKAEKIFRDVNGEKRLEGHFPAWVVNRLLEIQRLNRQGVTVLDIQKQVTEGQLNLDKQLNQPANKVDQNLSSDRKIPSPLYTTAFLSSFLVVTVLSSVLLFKGLVAGFGITNLPNIFGGDKKGLQEQVVSSLPISNSKQNLASGKQAPKSILMDEEVLAGETTARYLELNTNTVINGILVGNSAYFGSSNTVGTSIDSKGNITASGNIGIGTTIPGANLDVNGTTNISGRLTLSDIFALNNSEPKIVITDGSTLNITDGTNNLLILKDSGNVGDLTIPGTTTSNGDLTGKGKLKVSGDTTLSGSLEVSGASTLTGALTASSTLKVSSATTLSSTLAVTGASTLAGAASITDTTQSTSTTTGSLIVSGGAGIAKNVYVGGNLTVTGTTTSTGASTFTGQILASDGTVAAPGYSFSSDTDTGIYRSATNTLDFSSGGVRTLQLNTTSSAVNYLTIAPAAASSGPTLVPAGSDTNIPLTINSLLTGALTLDSTSTGSVNLGTGSNAKTVTVGNATSTTALAFNSGTGSQTFTSNVATGTTTTSGFVFDATAITSGTGAYLVTDSVTTGRLLDIATSGNTWTGNSTTNGLVNLASTSTAGTVSDSSILFNLSRSGANANTAHTAYGLYSNVTNTNATSGTNIGGYFSASGATTANYGLLVANGNVGIGDTTPDAKLEVLSTTEQLRLTYTDGSVDSRFTVDSAGDLTIDNTGTQTILADDLAVNGGDITTSQTTATVFNTTATTLSLGGAATTALNLGNGSGNYTAINLGSGAGTHTINIAGTGATAADTINIGTGGTGADTINIGSSASSTAFNLTTGTGAQTFTSNVATGTTTTSGFVFDATAITSGTGMYVTADALTTGTLASIATTGNTFTSGTLLSIASTSTAITSGKFLDISNGSSILSVSNTDFTTSLPTNFTGSGDVGVANDLQFTNPTSSNIKSLSQLAIVAGETFNSSNLTLQTYNAGSVVINSGSSASTGTTGLLNVVANSITTSNIGFAIDYISDSGVTAAADLFAAKINLTQNDADGDLFGLVITNQASTNAGADDVECLLCIDNAENTASAVTDAIRITSTGVAAGITYDLKLQNSETITNSTDGTISFGVTGAEELSLTATALSPVTSDGLALGTTALMWADLFLASGSVVNFNNGDVTITHATDALTVAGGNFNADGGFDVDDVFVVADGGAATFNTDVDFTLAGGENVVLTNASNTTAAAGLLDINGTGSTTDSRTADISTTFTSTGATTSYGLSNAWTSTAVVTGASVSQTGYGIYNTATKTGADDATGTYSLYGLYSTASNTGRTAAGTVNTYGGYFDATGDSAGTTSVFGVYIADVSGGDTNVGLCFDCDGTWTSSTVASGIQFGTDANAVTLYRSASDTLRTGDSLTVDLDLTVTGNDLTFGNGETIDNNSNGQINFNTGVAATGDGIYIDSGATTSTANGLCHSGADADNAAFSDRQIVACAGTVDADFAEQYPVATDIEVGDVLAVGSKDVTTTEGDTVKELVKSTSEYQSNYIGVASANDSDFATAGYNIKAEDNPKPVALVGRVLVKIASYSQIIQPGDLLTTSSEAGKAMKAARPGQMVGKALETWTPGSGKDKIMVFVNTSYADPNDLLANLSLDDNGNLIIPKLKSGTILIDAGVNLTVSQVKDYLSYGSTTLTTGQTAYSIDVAESLNTISDKLVLLDSLNQSQTDQSAVLAEQIASSSAVIASVAKQSDNTKSALDSLKDNIASATATLAATKSDIEELKLTPPQTLFATGSATLDTLTVSSDATISAKLSSYDLSVSNIFKSLGKAILGDTTVAGSFSVDGTLSIDNGSEVNAIPTLYLQKSNLSSTLDVLNGKFIFDNTGRLTVSGEVLANQFSVKNGKSSGTATISSGQTQLVVDNNYVDQNSVILLTSHTPLNQTLAVTEKLNLNGSGAFTVKLSTPELADITFDYLIVGVKE